MNVKTSFLRCMAILAVTTALSQAQPFSYDSKENVIGIVNIHQVKQGESLLEIARSFGLGFNQIIEANPGLDPFFPGTTPVIVPTSWIIPDPPAAGGILINVSEMRLYHYSKKNGGIEVTTFPIGVGSDGTDTPVGSFSIIEKVTNPAWRVPLSIRKEHPELPPLVPPGDDNPLGTHALRLSLGDVLIHGTNRPWGIGRKATHGCIRLYPEHIATLYEMVPVGTPVTIVHFPVKVGFSGDKIYVEIHQDPALKNYDYRKQALTLLRKKGLLGKIDRTKLEKALKAKQGFPVDVS
jgi:L,D-transpeptidase ErfK/SrfK